MDLSVDHWLSGHGGGASSVAGGRGSVRPRGRSVVFKILRQSLDEEPEELSNAESSLTTRKVALRAKLLLLLQISQQ